MEYAPIKTTFIMYKNEYGNIKVADRTLTDAFNKFRDDQYSQDKNINSLKQQKSSPGKKSFTRKKSSPDKKTNNLTQVKKLIFLTQQI